jgi:hypothetical protein
MLAAPFASLPLSADYYVQITVLIQGIEAAFVRHTLLPPTR